MNKRDQNSFLKNEPLLNALYSSFVKEMYKPWELFLLSFTPLVDIKFYFEQNFSSISWN